MGKVQLVTMVAENIIEVKNGLTDEVLKHIPSLVDATFEELKNLKRNNKDVYF